MTVLPFFVCPVYFDMLNVAINKTVVYSISAQPSLLQHLQPMKEQFPLEDCLLFLLLHLQPINIV